MDSNQTRRTSQNGKIYFKHQSNFTLYYLMLLKLFWYSDHGRYSSVMIKNDDAL